MHYAALFVWASSLIVLAKGQAVHLDCAADPNSTCDPARYCEWSQNNANCAFSWGDQQDNVPTFHECASDSTCNPGDSCINGLCCNTGVLAGGAADCPSSTTDLANCCFQRTAITGGDAVWEPAIVAEPSQLTCGC